LLNPVSAKSGKAQSEILRMNLMRIFSLMKQTYQMFESGVFEMNFYSVMIEIKSGCFVAIIDCISGKVDL